MNLNKKRKTPKPVFLKISPDLEEDQQEMIVQTSVHFGLSGLVATNTTINKDVLHHKKSVEALGAGGLSGRPLQATSNRIVQKIKALSPPDFVLMGSGGIMDEASALSCFSAGADLVQIYSGLVYSGPFLPLRILESIGSLKQ
jgi:dihydroorotate dehydrogenase